MFRSRQPVDLRTNFSALSRLLAWAGLVILLTAYAHLAFRQDSSFFTVPWMPREMARRILSVTHYRNLLGFGILGFYCAVVLGAWWWIRRAGRWQWAAFALWLLPLIKELMQTLVQGRHGTVTGSLYGVAGSALGLAVGSGCRATIEVIVRSWRDLRPHKDVHVKSVQQSKSRDQTANE